MSYTAGFVAGKSLAQQALKAAKAYRPTKTEMGITGKGRQELMDEQKARIEAIKWVIDTGMPSMTIAMKYRV